MHQDKPSREPSMKLSHVVILSLIGMLTTSLSVLVFTSPRQALQDALTSNKLETSVAPTASSAPNTPLVLEIDSTAPTTTGNTAPSATPSASASALPFPIPSQYQPWPSITELMNNVKGRAELVLSAPREPCSFFVGDQQVPGTDKASLYVPAGWHRVRCVRPNKREQVAWVQVVPEQRNSFVF